MKQIAALLVATCSLGFAAVVGAGASTADEWRLTDVTNVAAFSTGDGVLTSATVQLSDPCHEAQMRRYQGQSHVYAAYTRVRPEDRGKMCIQSISKQRVAFYEKGSIPKLVRIVGADHQLTPFAVLTANTK
jgi:hypothetical protein